KVAIIGANGVGKTTLCRLLVGELKPDAGKVEWGHQVSAGDLPQDLCALLGKMLFKGEEGLKSTAVLSGGEAVRMLLARLMLLKDNVLVLDEPTNHLDLESIVALGDALQRYE